MVERKNKGKEEETGASGRNQELQRGKARAKKRRQEHQEGTRNCREEKQEQKRRDRSRSIREEPGTAERK
jgi:hypothetical protein